MTNAITLSTNQKKTVDEVELSISTFSSSIPPSLIEQTFPCYSGSLAPVDYSKMRPMDDFIGPLEHDILPDSPARKAIWLACLHFNQQEAINFFSTISGIDIIKRVDSPESLFFPETDCAMQKNCFDEAFEDNAVYQQAVKSSKTYAKMRLLAFEERNPRSLLQKLGGYREVAKPSKGDLIIYFANIKPLDDESPAYEIPTYSSQRIISHYGRIYDIKTDGTLIIKSRFDYFHVYLHRIDCIPYFFGNSYLFFTKKRFAEESDFIHK